MSGMMRTPLAWTLRVMMSPVNSFEAVFLKVPMVPFATGCPRASLSNPQPVTTLGAALFL
jgi:hypothetical protein